MSVWKALCISFSIYSKIPVPQFKWKEEDMKYILCFFPWVGLVIFGVSLLWGWLCGQMELGVLCYSLMGAAIPILITGGFHIDGFMDTMDAFHSYGEREEKLRILKDPHIGAFSVIMLFLYSLIYVAVYSEIKNMETLAAVGGGFFLSRILSGISVVSFRPAKKDGLLHLFADRAQAGTVKAALYVQLLLAVAFQLFLSVKTGCLVLVAAGIVFWYYRDKSYRELGGITGDTAGYFVTVCELAICMAAVIGSRI